MKFVSIGLGIIMGLLMLGCASTQYSTYEGGGVQQGTGGSKIVVEGMEIWNHGTPPRKYRIIGLIDDARRRSLIGMAGYPENLVKKAREAGGDAIILRAHDVYRGTTTTPTYTTASTTGAVYGYGNTATYSGTTTAETQGGDTYVMRDRITQAAVIKYVK
jgi:hypothetical protein